MPALPSEDLSGVNNGAGRRETFAAGELAMVLSHFELGVITAVREFPRGSRKAPKLALDAESGQFLLKRRARGRDDLHKVAFTHAVQLWLVERQYPLPHLIGTRRANKSLLQHENGIYELFEFIPGENYSGSLDATFESGRVLALFHKLLEDFDPAVDYRPPSVGYHAAPGVETSLKNVPRLLPGVATGDACAELMAAYREAVEDVKRAGYDGWPLQVVHGDWHPGNMLFRGDKIVAVIDYDSARLLPRVIDAANGALQFSILGGGDDLAQWPDYVDESRFKRFLRGYDSVVLLSQAELRAVPHLMIEALVAEAAFPIGATGRFARFPGDLFLRMALRKARWLKQHAERLAELVEG